MKAKLYFFALLWMGILASCSDDTAPDVTVTTPDENLTLNAEKGESLTVDFTSTLDWTVEADVAWVDIEPKEGKGGSHRITVSANEANETGETRTALLTFKSGDYIKEVRVEQGFSDLLEVERKEFKIVADGKDIQLKFTTNLDFETLRLYTTQEVRWIDIIKPEADTRALQTGVINLRIHPNRSQSLRQAKFKIVSVGANDKIVFQSPDISVAQDGVPVSVSTDFSADGTWRIMQAHKLGRGVPLVIMGDGFVDTEIASGYYDRAMEKAMENFFTEEPAKSLRDYFDVWTVTAVSKHNAFGGSYQTAFSSELEGGNSTGIKGNHDMVYQYVRAVDAIRENVEKLEELTTIIVLNTSVYAGTAYWGFGFRQERPLSEFSIAYCPIIDGYLDAEYFRRVLSHESVGHAFGKLLDEYAYQSSGAVPEAAAKTYQEFQQTLDWAKNVSFTADRTQVPWKHLLEDERYQGVDQVGETLSVYEGAATYWTGAWRPTEESMMHNNIKGFNAPCRERIYKRVMSVAMGSVWQYDYEQFVAFDRAHLPMPARTRAMEVPSKPFANVRIAGQMLELKK